MINSSPESTILNVCIIPTVEVSNQCLQLSQSLKSGGTIFALDGITKFAHMTVYMARFANSEFAHVIQTARQTLLHNDTFLCEHTGYFMTSGRYLEASYRKSARLMALHERLVSSLSRYRLNPGNPFEEGYFTPYTEEQQRSAKETGYDLAYGLYRPHITLTRYHEDQLPETFPGFAPAKLSFMLRKICVYKADDNGAVYEKLEEFLL